MFKPDAIVVLGHACDRQGNLTRRQQLRAKKAFDLWQQNPQAYAITTGGIGRLFNRSHKPLAYWTGQYLKTLGLPTERLILENESLDTKQQSFAVKQIANNFNFQNLSIVSSFPHILRVKHFFDQQFDSPDHLRYYRSDIFPGLFFTIWDIMWEVGGWIKILFRSNG